MKDYQFFLEINSFSKEAITAQKIVFLITLECRVNARRAAYIWVGGGVHSTSWKFSLPFVHIFRTDWNFSTKFGNSDPSFNWNILTLLYLKSEMSAHAQIAVIHCYILLQVPWHDINLKLTLGMLFNKWSWSMILSSWSRDFF